MPKYQSKPVTVEAWCYGTDELPSDCNTNTRYDESTDRVEDAVEVHLLWVEKSQAFCNIDVGTYIIRERDGAGFYPCVADEFATRYDKLDESLTPQERGIVLLMQTHDANGWWFTAEVRKMGKYGDSYTRTWLKRLVAKGYVERKGMMYEWRLTDKGRFV